MNDFLTREWRENPLSAWLLALGILAGAIAVFLLVRWLVVRRLGGAAKRTMNWVDDLVVDVIQRTKTWFIILLAAVAAAQILTLPAGAVVGVKGGFLGSVLHMYPSEMAQNFWTAIFAWTTCFVVTLIDAGIAVIRMLPNPSHDVHEMKVSSSRRTRGADPGFPWCAPCDRRALRESRRRRGMRPHGSPGRHPSSPPRRRKSA
mgnify:CR=1 FL=1